MTTGLTGMMLTVDLGISRQKNAFSGISGLNHGHCAYFDYTSFNPKFTIIKRNSEGGYIWL